MGRKRRTAAAQAAPLPSAPQGAPGAQTLVGQALGFPRAGRLALTAAFAVSFALLMTPVIDNVYVTHFFSMDTRMLPSFISTGLGLLVYGVGWWLLIGQVGETPPSRPATVWYLLFGFGCLLLTLVLVIIGVYTNVFMRN